MEKGLFNSLFVLVMLVMLVPSTSLIAKTQNVTDTKYQIEEISFTSDSIIADAVSDRTYANSCVVDSSVNYDNVVDIYLKTFEIQKEKYSTVICSFSNLTTSIDAGKYYLGYVDINCSSSNEITKVSIIKRLYFNKEIIPTSGGGNCNIIINDTLNGGANQVYLNK